jgi:hypothetical protein
VKKKGLVQSRSAQVTVFIIIGIILLLTVGVIVYFQYAYKKVPTFELSEEPVTAYIQQCLVDITEEGVLLAGQNGGYIFQEELSDEQKEFLELLPFNSDTLLLANGKQQLRYWYYQMNDGIDRVAIPELEKQAEDDGSIQDQLERYVEQQLPVCLDNFEALEKTGKVITETGELSVSVLIADQAVEVTASLPLEIDEAGTTTTQDSFSATVPVGLRPAYELGREIAEHELNTLFLEQTTRNLLATYSQVNKEYLPPMAGGLHFEPCANRVFWFYNDVQEDVRQMLAANIPFLRVENTNYGEIIIDKKKEADEEARDLRQAVFDAFIIQLSGNNYENLLVNFNYQTNYPMDLMFGNNIGYGLIQPSIFEINILIANLCMFEYNYLYNLKYPVVVTITDPTSAIDQNAFIFQFPLQVVVKNNYPRIKLNDVLRGLYRIPEAVDEPSYQCDPEQRLSGESTITVEDPKGAPVEDAVVTFQCGPTYVYEYDVNGTVVAVHRFADACHMGTTDENGELTTKFPPCTGSGIVTVQSLEYTEKSVATGDIVQGASFEKTITLDKVYTRELSIQKYFVAPPAITNEEGIGVHLDDDGNVVACNVNMDPKEFFPYETAMVTLTKLDTENGVLNTVPIVVYEVATGEATTIDVAAGEYYVDIMLMREERYAGEMTIDAHSEMITVPSTIGTDIITYPDEDVLIPETFSGGAVFLWNVTAAELESGDTIIFTVFDEGIPTTVEQVSAPLLHREACSDLNSELVVPEVR